MKFKTILALVVLVLAVVIIVQNTQVVTYRALLWSVSVSQIILLPAALLLGFLIGFLVGKASGRGRN